MEKLKWKFTKDYDMYCSNKGGFEIKMPCSKTPWYQLYRNEEFIKCYAFSAVAIAHAQQIWDNENKKRTSGKLVWRREDRVFYSDKGGYSIYIFARFVVSKEGLSSIKDLASFDSLESAMEFAEKDFQKNKIKWVLNEGILKSECGHFSIGSRIKFVEKEGPKLVYCLYYKGNPKAKEESLEKIKEIIDNILLDEECSLILAGKMKKLRSKGCDCGMSHKEDKLHMTLRSDGVKVDLTIEGENKEDRSKKASEIIQKLDL